MNILHPRDFRCYKNGRYARDLRVGQEPMVCPELEMVLMMMMMVMMMKLARVTVPWRCVFFYYYVVFLWKPLNAALIAVWLFVTWGQIVISYVDPK